MAIVVDKSFHGISALESCGIQCITDEVAQHEDIRTLNVGIINIMPRDEAEDYEIRLLRPLHRSVIQIRPIWIHLENRPGIPRNKDSVLFRDGRDLLDGLIITGAPVEKLAFEEVHYWQEMKEGILDYARENIPSTLGICWGALAMAKILGIEKEVYDKKIFGVFRTENLDKGKNHESRHHITGYMDDWFWCPQSRYAGIADAALEQARDDGKVRLLAHSKEAGYVIFESADNRFLAHLGHPEYGSGRLLDEYNRDKKIGLAGLEPPVNVDLEHPENLWRSHRTEFFTQWIKYLHNNKKENNVTK